MDTRVTVWRPLNGISINGEMEQLLDESKEPMIFANQDEAKSFLIKQGLDPDFYNYYPELCETCRNKSGCTIQEAEEQVIEGICDKYILETGGRV